MKALPRIILVLLLLLACTALVVAQPSREQCHPETDPDNQQRTLLKHRSPALRTSSTAIVVENIFAWGTPANASNSTLRLGNEPIDPRETKIYTLEARIWLMKVDDGDCDIHMELSGIGSKEKDARVIVEIPVDSPFAADRNKVLRKRADLKAARLMKGDKLKQPVRIKITGYAFYDGSHWKRNDRTGVGHNHGSKVVASLWELHPAWGIEFLD